MCTASGDWSGSNVTSSGSGTLSVGTTTGTRTYTLTCTGPNGSASDSVSVSVVEPALTSAQQLELRRAAGALRSVVDVIMLSARYTRPYIEAQYPYDNTTVACADSGTAALRALPDGTDDALLMGTFTRCVDETVELDYGGEQTSILAKLDPSGVGTWQTFSVVTYGDSRFEHGQIAVNNGLTAALRAQPQSNGTTAYEFKYQPTREVGSPLNRDYCGPARKGVVPDSGCHFFDAHLAGTIDASRTELRLHQVENSILELQSNKTFKKMTITASSEVVAPILAEGLFGVHFDDFSQGLFRYERAEAAGHIFVVDLVALSNTTVRVTVTETLPSTTTSSTRDMSWNDFFARPYYTP